MIRSAINSLDEIKKDPESDNSRLLRYFEAYKKLLTKLDKRAFTRSDTKIFKGIPAYIPDGFSDMGGDSSLNDATRTREKQYVNKSKIFEKSNDFLTDLIAQKEPIASSQTVHKIAHHVFTDMPYDHEGTAFKEFPAFNFGKSITLDDYLDKNKPKAVCRNQALYTQVLLQSLGIKSRLLKCKIKFPSRRGGAHAANLIKGKDVWYLLDTSNPVMRNGEAKISVTELEDKYININKQIYQWKIPTDKGDYVYTSRNNMFYRVKETY